MYSRYRRRVLMQYYWLLLISLCLSHINALASFASDQPSCDHKSCSRPPTTADSSLIHQRTEILKMLEDRLLASFGLNARPRPTDPPSIPAYMLDLYLQQQQRLSPSAFAYEHDSPTDRSISQGWRDAVTKRRDSQAGRITMQSWANTIRAHPLISNDQEGNAVRFYFDVSLPSHERLVAAELRLYARPIQGANFPQTFSLAVDDLIPISAPVHLRSDKPYSTRRLDAQSGSVTKAMWLHFDVFQAVQRWLYSSDKANQGLLVHSNGISGMVLNNDSIDEQQWLEFKPVLLTHSEDPQGAAPKSLVRRRRSESKSDDKSDKKLNDSPDDESKRREEGKRVRAAEDEYCKRHLLYVDFRDVGWSDWIIAPPGYQAFVCMGRCYASSNIHGPRHNTTNHAVVRTLLNAGNAHLVPPACCVPTELSAMTMLYVDYANQIVLRSTDDMVVEGCGCR